MTSRSRLIRRWWELAAEVGGVYQRWGQAERERRNRENTREKNKEYYDYITSRQVKRHDVAESYILSKMKNINLTYR